MKAHVGIAFASAVWCLTGGANAAGDPARGKELAAPCVTCHGTDGIALVETYPNIAGQNAAYMESAIKAYRDGQRTGGIAGLMIPMAKQLSDQQVEDLAAYFASLPLEPRR